MDSLDLDQVMDEIIPRGDNRPPAPNFPVRQRPRATDDATAALDLVSQAAAAIKELEKQSAQAVARAHSAANAVREKLERAEDRGVHLRLVGLHPERVVVEEDHHDRVEILCLGRERVVEFARDLDDVLVHGLREPRRPGLVREFLDDER